MDDKAPAASVIVCTRERPDDLDRCLAAVTASAACSGISVEVLVVDNAPSTERTRAVAASHPVRYVLAPERGLGRARNVGIDHARGEALAFTDDDVVVEECWVAAMCLPILERRADAVAGEVVPGEGWVKPWMSRDLQRSTFGTISAADGEAHHFIGASFAVEKGIANAFRFDENLGAGSDLGSGEDVLFYEQVRASGARIIPAGCEVVHNVHLTRLRYDRLRATADAQGRSEGYLAHHWLHSEIRWVRLRRWRNYVQLWRAPKGPLIGEEGIGDTERAMRIAIAYKKQLLIERRRGVPRHLNPEHRACVACERAGTRRGNFG